MPDLTGIDKGEDVREMIRTVGAEAYEQAADFLELSGEKIKEYFLGLGITSLDIIRSRGKIVDNWSWQARVQVTSVRGGSFYCGISLSAPRRLTLHLRTAHVA
jgi:hypothetical protein